MADEAGGPSENIAMSNVNLNVKAEPSPSAIMLQMPEPVLSQHDEEGGDHELVFDSLAFLEDMLFEPWAEKSGIDSDEEECVWNANESKEAASFRRELDALQRRLLPLFEQEVGAEFSLEHTQAHADFKALVEQHVDSFLVARGLTTSGLVIQLKLAMQGQVVWAREGAAEVCGLLQSVDDFEQWARAMRRKAAANAREDRKKKSK